MATFDNNLRIKEIATGAEAGSWGTSTNTNLSLIADALGYATEATFDTDGNKTVSVANATSSPYRSMYVKVTSSATLSATRDLTIGPNTIKRVMFIENATTGGQSIVVKQGSGASVTITNGSVMCVLLDGAGAGAAVISVFTDFVATDSVKITGTTPTLTLGDGDAEDAKIVFDGNAQDFYIGLDDTGDDLKIGRGTAVGTTSQININNDGTTSFSNNNTNGSVSLCGSSYTIDVFKAAGGEMLNLASDGGSNGTFMRLDTDNSAPIKIGSAETGAFQYYHNNVLRAEFEADGDLRLHTAGKGIMLKSPDGSNFLLTVSNAGALVIG